jgi:hypothetical protein
LAYLLEKARTEDFAVSLFPHDIDRDPYLPPRVDREMVLEQRRADVLIRWASACTHVEVKVGDHNFEKTKETAEELERKIDAPKWDHYILVPKEDVPNAVKCLGHEAHIRTLTWDAVAVALRRALVSAREDVRWRVFAHALCGGIEQHLLHCLRADQEPLHFAEMVSRQRLISIMKESTYERAW